MLGWRSLRSPARYSIRAGCTKGGSKKLSSVLASSNASSQPIRLKMRQIRIAKRNIPSFLEIKLGLQVYF